MTNLLIKPDVIVSWPRNTEYPLWRVFISSHRELFNKVFVVFTETHHGDDYRSFVRSVLSQESYDIIDSPLPNPGEDWRNVAINEALKRSTSDWLWFTEQDFFVMNDLFWSEVNEAISEYKMQFIGVLQGARVHPCSLFITRKLLEITHKDFSIDPGKLDHFGKLIAELRVPSIPMSFIDPLLWKHYNGLSHNFRLVSEYKDPVYEPVAFLDYLARCLQANTEIDVRFKAIAENALKKDVKSMQNHQ